MSLPSQACTLFIAYPLTAEAILAGLLEVVDAAAFAQDHLDGIATYRLTDNPQVEPERIHDPDQGFLYFPWRLDLAPVVGVKPARYQAYLGGLLESLWQMGWWVVAVSAFAEQLPYHGRRHFPKVLASNPWGAPLTPQEALAYPVAQGFVLHHGGDHLCITGEPALRRDLVAIGLSLLFLALLLPSAPAIFKLLGRVITKLAFSWYYPELLLWLIPVAYMAFVAICFGALYEALLDMFGRPRLLIRSQSLQRGYAPFPHPTYWRKTLRAQDIQRFETWEEIHTSFRGYTTIRWPVVAVLSRRRRVVLWLNALDNRTQAEWLAETLAVCLHRPYRVVL